MSSLTSESPNANPVLSLSLFLGIVQIIGGRLIIEGPSVYCKLV